LSLSESSGSKPPTPLDRFKPLTIEVDFERIGFSTTTKHGQSIDARLHRPVPSAADIGEGEGFYVYIEKNKRAILLVRASELNTQDKVQGLFKAFGAAKFMTPDLAMSILSEAKKAENAAYGEAVKRIKEPFGLLNKGHVRARKKKRR
jgi:hypothetical protein